MATQRLEMYVALLRGLNVGGKNRLPMRELRDVFLASGCHRVQTYIQSGNVVFAAGTNELENLSDRIMVAIEERFGLTVPLVTRSAPDLARVIESNPFDLEEDDSRGLHVGFLLDEPDPRDVTSLDPNRSPSDRFQVSGREVYLWCPNGIGRSKLTTQYFDSRLHTVMTVRNWRTVNRLAEMASVKGLGEG